MKTKLLKGSGLGLYLATGAALLASAVGTARVACAQSADEPPLTARGGDDDATSAERPAECGPSNRYDELPGEIVPDTGGEYRRWYLDDGRIIILWIRIVSPRELPIPTDCTNGESEQSAADGDVDTQEEGDGREEDPAPPVSDDGPEQTDFPTVDPGCIDPLPPYLRPTSSWLDPVYPEGFNGDAQIGGGV